MKHGSPALYRVPVLDRAKQRETEGECFEPPGGPSKPPIQWNPRLKWVWLGMLIVSSLWLFGEGMYVQADCFRPENHWEWWFWRERVITVLVPWALTGAGILAYRASRWFR
jgi:hypothetical protein